MNNSLREKSGIKLAFSFIGVQLIICLMVVVSTFVVFDRKMATAALVGCMVNVVAVVILPLSRSSYRKMQAPA